MCPAASTKALESALAVLVAHTRRQRSDASDRQLVARAIARLATQLQLASSHPAEPEVAPNHDAIVVAPPAKETHYNDVVAGWRDDVSQRWPLADES